MSGLENSSKNITSNVVEKKEVTVPWWRRTKFTTEHLEGLNWEVVVVDLNIKNAYVLPGGKIVVYRGILEPCKSYAQVAAIIGHEVSTDYCLRFVCTFFRSCFFNMVLVQSTGIYNTYLGKYEYRVVKIEREAVYFGDFRKFIVPFFLVSRYWKHNKITNCLKLALFFVGLGCTCCC